MSSTNCNCLPDSHTLTAEQGCMSMMGLITVCH